MFFVLVFLPAWIGAKILNSMGMLRVPREAELAGLDILEMESRSNDQATFIKAERGA